MALTQSVELNNGLAMPIFGLGLYQSESGEEAQRAVRHAVELGYRHFDSAAVYKNEADLGQALKDTGIARDEVFVTTKLWNDDQGYDAALRAFDASLEKLGLERVDLYLIHWPKEGERKESWRALEEIYKSGRARAIGVSNYTIPHLEELLAHCQVTPAVNQVEFSPFLFQRDLLDFCRQAGIQLEAYSPLTRGKRLDDATLTAVAQKHNKTAAQVLIRWAIDHQVVVIPKSVTPSRIEENAAVFDFELDGEDLTRLDALNEDFRTCWDPTGKP